MTGRERVPTCELPAGGKSRAGGGDMAEIAAECKPGADMAAVRRERRLEKIPFTQARALTARGAGGGTVGSMNRTASRGHKLAYNEQLG